MPNPSRFVPDDFLPPPKTVKWAKEEFRIDEKEILRQLDLMRDWEFRRTYTDWNKTFRNWLKSADCTYKDHPLKGLRRERQYRQVQELTEDERKIEAGKAEENLERLQQMALKVVK